MNLITLAAVATLRLLDPTGDAAGDGTLMPPTSTAYANASVFDLQEVALTPGATEGEPATLVVGMGSIELSDALPAGFNRVVVDVYLDDGEGGAEATLEGPALLMPPGSGWEYVVRVSPRGAFGAAAPTDEAAPVAWQPLPLVLDEDAFVVTLPWQVGAGADVYAVSGLYDAFSPTEWRPLSRAPSPWSFSSTEQVAPVVDVLAADQDTQVRVLARGLLQPPERRRDAGLPWLLLAIAGVVVALYGLWLRRRVPAAMPAELPAPAPEAVAMGPAEPEAVAEEVAPGPAEAVVAAEGAEPGGTVPAAPEDEAAATAIAEAEPAGQEPAGPEESTARDGPEPEVPGAETAAEGAEPAEAEAESAEPSAAAPTAGPPQEGPAEEAAVPGEVRPDADALMAGWTEEEPEDDDLAAFVSREPRAARELRVEHSDDEES